MSRDLIIRPLEASDRAEWTRLWTAYLAFYKTTLTPEVFDSSFARLMSDAANEYKGLIAVLDCTPVGLAHYLFHRDMWTVEDTCYMMDLFVDPGTRGAGVGRALIDAVSERCRAQGVTTLYWHTEDTNHTAQALYDTLATKVPFIKYDKAVKDA
ncbi:GNAT family N-acetyltransferase [Roseovarius sp. 2305UL8-3]|uniref:GNAT family N-acetyltransferase n=1 Tax=Roseovarius conchicola TaxID=3121636 RepID=UPI003529D314